MKRYMPSKWIDARDAASILHELLTPIVKNYRTEMGKKKGFYLLNLISEIQTSPAQCRKTDTLKEEIIIYRLNTFLPGGCYEKSPHRYAHDPYCFCSLCRKDDL